MVPGRPRGEAADHARPAGRSDDGAQGSGDRGGAGSRGRRAGCGSRLRGAGEHRPRRGARTPPRARSWSLEDRGGARSAADGRPLREPHLPRARAGRARYVVRESGRRRRTPVTVLRFEDHPAASFYAARRCGDGLQYIETRDGTLLAAMVRPPLGQTLATVRSRPSSSTRATRPPIPTARSRRRCIASALGFATVGVNMRGSGCSGGVLDLFDLPTTADGYDIIETVAAQPWVQRRQGRHGRHLVPGHQPALRRRRAPAAPRARSRRSR